MYPFQSLLAVIGRKPNPRLAGAGLSAKELALALLVGAATFSALFLAFLLAARSALV
jgi:hypothetical protein